MIDSLMVNVFIGSMGFVRRHFLDLSGALAFPLPRGRVVVSLLQQAMDNQDKAL